MTTTGIPQAKVIQLTQNIAQLQKLNQQKTENLIKLLVLCKRELLFKPDTFNPIASHREHQKRKIKLVQVINRLETEILKGEQP